jgi:hypothetical protein
MASAKHPHTPETQSVTSRLPQLETSLLGKPLLKLPPETLPLAKPTLKLARPPLAKLPLAGLKPVRLKPATMR